MLMRRRGRPLVRMAATTAVVAGTAGAVHHHQEQKYAKQAADQQAAAEQAAYEQSATEQGAAVQQSAPAEAPAPAANAVDMEQLQELAELHTAGILSDDEFSAAKAKVLGIG
jgi:hypothetical protein